MADNEPKKGSQDGAAAGADARSPFGDSGQKELREFQEVLTQLDNGQISPEKAQSRVMAIYQLGVGAGLRAIGEMRPGLVASIAKRLTRDLDLISKHYDAEAPDQPAQANRSTQDFRLKGKASDVLLRERIILRTLTSSNATFAFSEIKTIVSGQDPGINDPTLTANLDRLLRLGRIARPSKGYYASCGESRTYLAALENEISTRGLP